MNQPPDGVLDHPVMKLVWQGCRSRITFSADTIVRWGAAFGQSINLDEAIRCCEHARQQLWCELVQDAPVDSGQRIYIGAV